MSTCSSCGAVIRWAITVNDKRIPLDPEPRDDGNLAFRDDDKVYVIPGGPGVLGLEVPRYVSHFATCPSAAQHRRR